MNQFYSNLIESKQTQVQISSSWFQMGWFGFENEFLHRPMAKKSINRPRPYVAWMVYEWYAVCAGKRVFSGFEGPRVVLKHRFQHPRIPKTLLPGRLLLVKEARTAVDRTYHKLNVFLGDPFFAYLCEFVVSNSICFESDLYWI